MKKQEGAVLLISIILLLVLTLISLSALNSSTIQEISSSNYQNENEVFQSTESALANQVSSSINKTNLDLLQASMLLNGEYSPQIQFTSLQNPDIITFFSVRHDGAIVLEEGLSLDIDNSSALITGQNFSFESTSSKGTEENSTETTISQGINFY